MKSKKLWGGRFTKKTNSLVESFTNSIQFDQQLAEFDCMGSLLHIQVLKKAQILNTSEYERLRKGLQKILVSIQNGTFQGNPSFEDIHSYIQHLLEKDPRVGTAALKLHTCRSRNDQVVFDTKLYCLYHIYQTGNALAELMQNLRVLANKNKDIYLPGYTHLQRAMPISLEHYFGAYANMLERDNKRIHNAFNNIHLAMGAGALAGTFIEASKYNQAIGHFLKEKHLNISATDNPIDTVSDRDFIIEILSALAIVGMHLSRFAEDLILWATSEFNFIEIDDSFCTGSSLMPHKKNPDVLELIRGYTGRLYGNLLNVCVVMKGLPLAYNRDMQHDKEPLFDSFRIIKDELKIFSELIQNITFNQATMQKQLDDECLYATDLADYLVQNGVPFKTAHQLVGQLIQMKFNEQISLSDMHDSQLKKIHPRLSRELLKSLFNPKKSVMSKRSIKKIKQKFHG